MAKPIIEGADGVTLASAGLMVIREHADFVDNVFAGKASDQERVFRFVMTINHEAIHFLQCFTASFPYSFSMSLFEIASQVMGASRADLLSSKQIEEFKRGFEGQIAQFRSPYQNISTIDLLEAMAVTESYHSTIPDLNNNASDFRQFLLSHFPNRNSEYRRVIDLITDVFGIEADYHLTPRLSYISLNSDQPAKTLSKLIDSLASHHRAVAHRLTAIQILNLFGMEISTSLLKMSETELPDDAKHPIFEPCMRALSRIGSLEDRYEFSAQPGNWMRSNSLQEIGEMIVPPLLVCTGGRGRIMGLAKNWSKVEVVFYLERAAIIGTCLVLLSGDKYQQTCKHIECPAHSSTLCYSWFAKPHSISWTNCLFPKSISDQFGVSATRLVEIFTP